MYDVYDEENGTYNDLLKLIMVARMLRVPTMSLAMVGLLPILATATSLLTMRLLLLHFGRPPK